MGRPPEHVTVDEENRLTLKEKLLVITLSFFFSVPVLRVFQ